MAKSKSFTINNPAELFYSAPAKAEEPETVPEEKTVIQAESEPVKKPAPVRRRQPKEKKTERVQIVLKPSQLEELDRITIDQGISRNAAIAQAIDLWLKQNKE